MKTLKGTSIASGVARGVVCVYAADTEETLPHYSLAPEQVPQELERFRAALSRAQDDMRRMIAAAGAQKDAQAADIFNAHLLILSDQSLSDKIVSLISGRAINAEHAVSDAFGEHIKRYQALEGHFQELTHDLVDTRDRIIQAFGHDAGHFKCEIGVQNAVIVAAKRLTPSMVLTIPRDRVLAFVAEEGGVTSHATILARAYNVPMVFGVKVDDELDCGMPVIVDGSRGVVVISPDNPTAAYYDNKIADRERKQDACRIAGKDPASTRAGERIALKVNLSTPDDIALVKGLPHDGIGLLRTEFLFMQKDRPPDEEEQVRTYQSVFDACPQRPVTVRLLDISSDKLPPFLVVPEGVNPDMELRGAMAVEVFPELFITQIKALLRANRHGTLRMLYPMVSDVSDLLTFRAAVAKAKEQLAAAGTPFNPDYTEGVMIETPAAVLMIEQLFSEVAFVNIGSNDLLQYTLAAARGSALAEARYHILHPALVKLLTLAASAGRRAKKDVCLCGEIASFEEYYPVLLDTGLSSFSVAAGKFSDIKCELMHLDAARDGKVLSRYYTLRSKQDADAFLAAYEYEQPS